MKKSYKKLLGNRIFVEIPKKEESKLIVDENTKEALQKQMLKTMSKLTVYDVGDLITNIKIGDVILVDPSKLKDAMIIPITDDKNILLVSPFDVIMIW